jgi:hypothetical protein
LVFAACSPEASRTRDGGPGADPGNKPLVNVAVANPRAADTTLWPGRAPAPVERLARGEMPPPASASGAGGQPVTPKVQGSASEQRTFDRGTSANPRQQTSSPGGARKPR